MIRLLCTAAAAVTAAICVSAPATADPQSDLTGLLPMGYTADSCVPVADQGALAALSCGPNSIAGAPTSATYRLFADRSATDAAFTTIANSPEWTPVPCPDASSASPVPVVTANGITLGSILCLRAAPGFYAADRDGAVAWTKDDEHVVGLGYVGYLGERYPVDLYRWAVGIGA